MFLFSMKPILMLWITVESQWRACHRKTASKLRWQWGDGVRTWVVLLIHGQTKLSDMRSSLKQNSCAPTQTFDWDKLSLQRFPGDPDVASIWKQTIYSKVIYTILTKVAERLSLLMQLVSHLFLEVIIIYGDIDSLSDSTIQLFWLNWPVTDL